MGDCGCGCGRPPQPAAHRGLSEFRWQILRQAKARRVSFVHNPPQAHRTICYGTSTEEGARFATGTHQNNPNEAPEPADRERRRLAVAGMSPRRNRPPPALRTPSVPFIKPHRATAGRRASFAALRNAMSVIGTVSSDHRFRPARAIASAIQELRFGTREHFPQEHRSARERRPLKAPGAHSSQGAGSTTSGGHDGLQNYC